MHLEKYSYGEGELFTHFSLFKLYRLNSLNVVFKNRQSEGKQRKLSQNWHLSPKYVLKRMK